MILLQESPPEIVLTLKKRPRHTKVYGQIYMKPYRLPSRKRDGNSWFRWKDNLPSPRLLDLPPITIPKYYFLKVFLECVFDVLFVDYRLLRSGKASRLRAAAEVVVIVNRLIVRWMVAAECIR